MKKSNRFICMLLLAIISLLISCDPWDVDLSIVNKSDKVIYFFNSDDYPDTTINFVYNPLQSPEFYRIGSGVTKVDRIRGSWEDRFAVIDTLMIFIFDEDTLKTVPWQEIQERYIILKRYDLSYNDLQEMNWTVTYP